MTDTYDDPRDDDDEIITSLNLAEMNVEEGYEASIRAMVDALVEPTDANREGVKVLNDAIIEFAKSADGDNFEALGFLEDVLEDVLPECNMISETIEGQYFVIRRISE